MAHSLEGQIRDFVYLDTDRLRSYVAQLYEGVPEVFAETSGQEKSGKGEAGIDIPALVKAGIGGSILYQQSSTETKSTHHYLYTLFEQKLAKINKLKIVNDNFSLDDWVETNFQDGMFVLVQGKVQIVDYNSVVAVLSSLPRIIDLVIGLNRQTLKQKIKESKIDQKEYDRQLKSVEATGLDKKDVVAVTEMVGKLYSGFSRVKVFPFADKKEHCFVGNVPRQYFSAEQVNPFLSCGLISGSNWSVMGLVNMSSTSPDAISFESGAGATRNLEDTLEQLVFAVQEINKVTLSAKFPTVSFLPIAIYRPC